jgi:hypothetical protein
LSTATSAPQVIRCQGAMASGLHITKSKVDRLPVGWLAGRLALAVGFGVLAIFVPSAGVTYASSVPRKNAAAFGTFCQKERGTATTGVNLPARQRSLHQLIGFHFHGLHLPCRIDPEGAERYGCRKQRKRTLGPDPLPWRCSYLLASGSAARSSTSASMCTFDLVFCAGVLYNLRHPLLGLERLRSVTRGMMILETSPLIPACHEWVPLMTFFPGDADASKFEWRHGGFPTQAWVSDALLPSASPGAPSGYREAERGTVGEPRILHAWSPGGDRRARTGEGIERC